MSGLSYSDSICYPQSSMKNILSTYISSSSSTDNECHETVCTSILNNFVSHWAMWQVLVTYRVNSKAEVPFWNLKKKVFYPKFRQLI